MPGHVPIDTRPRVLTVRAGPVSVQLMVDCRNAATVVHTVPVDSVLVSLPVGAGVVRTDDGLMVTGNVADGSGGTGLRDADPFHPVKAWVSPTQCVVGGLLPPGAVSADVVDDRGERVPAVTGQGAYAALLNQRNDGREPVVCCRDSAGRPVRRPWAADYPHHRVDDAKEPCPACGITDWDEYQPFENWRGGRGSRVDGTNIASPVVSCRICGHEQREGAIMRSAAPDGEDEAVRAERVARERAEHRVQRWYANTLTLRAVTFPVYAVENWPTHLRGSSSQNDALTELTIAHVDSEDADLLDSEPSIEVTTSTDPHNRDELTVARSTLERWVSTATDQQHSTELSDAAITLWFDAAARRRRAAALNATRSETQITIDGSPAPFLTLTTPDGRWVATRRHEDLTVTIAARDLNPATVSIEPVANRATMLLGPRPPQP